MNSPYPLEFNEIWTSVRDSGLATSTPLTAPRHAPPNETNIQLYPANNISTNYLQLAKDTPKSVVFLPFISILIKFTFKTIEQMAVSLALPFSQLLPFVLHNEKIHSATIKYPGKVVSKLSKDLTISIHVSLSVKILTYTYGEVCESIWIRTPTIPGRTKQETGRSK